MNYKFNLKNITHEDIYTGDIWIIQKVFDNLINNIKKYSPSTKDFSSLCYRYLAKKNVSLIKVNNKYYIDLDYIKSKKDIYNINELLNNNSKDNNILMTLGSDNPYVGQLYIVNIRKYKNKREEQNILKLINTQI